MPRHTPDKIISIVDDMESRRSALHQRMDSDMDRYHLKPYAGEIDENGKDVLAGYKKFTSNDPQTVMNLALHLGSIAKRMVRVQSPRANEQQREWDNMKELFALGVISAANRRRSELDQPELQDALFSQSLFRGRTCQRVVLVKEETGETDMFGMPVTRTYVDVCDWDPRNSYWGMGRNGMVWACEKSHLSRADIIAYWGVDPADYDEGDGDREDYDRLYPVYDYLDEEENLVVLGSQKVLKQAPHGMKRDRTQGRVPVAGVKAETRPQFRASEGTDYEEFYGESLYRADREIFDQMNFMLSVMSETAKRSIKQPLLVMSKDGSLTLDEGDPRMSGQQVSLSTDNNEALIPLPPLEILPTFNQLLSVSSGMMQRGSFNETSFGVTPFQLSGFAIQTLRQSILGPMTPHIKAVRRTFEQMLNILCDSYASGGFDMMEVSGRMQDPQRTYFSQTVDPQIVALGGEIEVEIVAELPQDDSSKVALAQMLMDGPQGPVADMRFIREYLGFQDPEQMERAVWEQQAARGNPVSIAFNSMMAAAKLENYELARLWEEEFQIQMMTRRLQMMQLAMMGGGGAGGPGLSPMGGAGGSGNSPLPRPQDMPPQMLGIRNAPGMQAGPNVPPGTPRPGAQGDVASRLASLGLVGPRG